MQYAMPRSSSPPTTSKFSPRLPYPQINVNPIEHIWDELDRRVEGRVNARASVRELFQSLQQECVAIPAQMIHNLLQSMPKTWWWWWLFPRLREFWENVQPFIPRLLFFFFLKWTLARTHQFHSLGQDQSTVAQPAETAVAQCSLTSCVWTRFRINSQVMSGQRHNLPTPTSLGQGYIRV